VGGLNSLLRCPDCQGALALESTIGCTVCGSTFPRLGTIPVLVSDAPSKITSWRRQLAAFSAETEAAERHLWGELASPHLAPATRLRLRSVAEAMPHHRELVLSLLSEVGLEPIAGASTLIHRDFSWPPEVDEVTPALESLLNVCPSSFRLGRTLVLGAGTGRLAWDLAVRFPSAEPVIALDLNPLPLLVSQRLLAEHDLELFELPGHPRSAAHAAVRRTLRPPTTPPQNLQLLIADGLSPPMHSGVFDTVVTPWFLDQVPTDLAAFLPEIARLLTPGGAWLHAGPFVYAPAHTKPAHRYGADEFLELAARAGFEVTSLSHEPAAYLCSPLSTQGRREMVLNLHAVKKVRAPSNPEPEWLAPTWSGAIPCLVLQSAAELPLPILHSVRALLDGTRTVADITSALLAQGELADDENAEVVVRGCLRILWSVAR
jgi:SAM-dependent methyltransferase